MSIDEAEVLKERAIAFLKNAEYLYSIGQYDLAMFSLEQYCQLILKY
jgi:HEPN domain-containing protein